MTTDRKKKYKESMLKYRRTPHGRIVHMVCRQRYNSKKKGFPPPEWTAKEMYVHAVNDKKFIRLFINWINSGYHRDLTPSIDRINPDKPYTWDNIQFMTSYENKHVKGVVEMVERRSKAIRQLNKITGEHIDEFPSLSEAARTIGRNESCISECANGKRKSAYGFGWEYVK